ncbi:MAG: hypothetical protein ACOX35_05250 [Bacillota bacterium]
MQTDPAPNGQSQTIHRGDLDISGKVVVTLQRPSQLRPYIVAI